MTLNSSSHSVSDAWRKLSYPSWWRHQMETFSAFLALCAGNSPFIFNYNMQCIYHWLSNFGTCIEQTSRGQLEYYCPLSKHEHHHMLTHWGRVTHVCVRKLTIIGSVNGLSPGWLQGIIWINAGILLIGPLGTDFNEILIRFQTFAFKNGLENVVCKMVATLSRRPCVKSWYIEVWWDRYAELRHFPAQGKDLSHKPKNTYVPYPTIHHL